MQIHVWSTTGQFVVFTCIRYTQKTDRLFISVWWGDTIVDWLSRFHLWHYSTLLGCQLWLNSIVEYLKWDTRDPTTFPWESREKSHIRDTYVLSTILFFPSLPFPEQHFNGIFPSLAFRGVVEYLVLWKLTQHRVTTHVVVQIQYNTPNTQLKNAMSLPQHNCRD